MNETENGYKKKARKLYESIGLPQGESGPPAHEGGPAEREHRVETGQDNAGRTMPLKIPRGRKELAALYEASGILGESLEPEIILERFIEIAVSKTNAERGLVFVLNTTTGKMERVAAKGIDGATLADADSYSRSIMESSQRELRTILCENAADDPRFRNNKSVMRLNITSFICAPLISREEFLGTFYLDSRSPVRAFGESDLHFIAALASIAAVAVRNAFHHSTVLKENMLLRKKTVEKYALNKIAANSPGMQRVIQVVEKLAETEITVLLSGETGTGKELVAKAIHHGGSRAEKPFLATNCAAMPSTLAESILFGYRKGAFTDAKEDRKGIFEAADGGTVFLDEIGDMSIDLQAKLLRVLQDREVVRIGESKPRNFNIRVISATNRNLAELVDKGDFRRDLYYRINVIHLPLPPLRERREDLPLLLEEFLAQSNSRHNKRVAGYSSETVRYFESYSWPGNVRELENAVEKGVALTLDDCLIEPGLFQWRDDPAASSGSVVGSGWPKPVEQETLKEAVEALERVKIGAALSKTGWNKSRAARILGLNRVVLLRKIEKYDMKENEE